VPGIPKRVKKAVLAASLLAALTLLAVNVWFHVLLTSQPVAFDNYVVLIILVALAPYGVLDYVDTSWRRKIDEYLPELLSDIAEAQRTGMTLPTAFEAAAKKHYGPLSREVRKLVVQMSWGATLENALQLLANRVGTMLARRMANLMSDALRFGAITSDVMDLAANYVRSVHLLEKERAAELRIYVIIIYVAFLVFAYCVVILLTTFFYRVSPVATGFVAGMMIPAGQIRRLFFHMALIQAVMSGLAAGKMSTGSIVAGVKHVCVLVVAAFAIFNWLAPPP